MSEQIRVELYGGSRDGHEFVVSGSLARVLEVPEADAPRLLDYAASPGPETATFRRVLYCWDGTVRADGVRRYRLRDEGSR